MPTENMAKCMFTRDYKQQDFTTCISYIAVPLASFCFLPYNHSASVFTHCDLLCHRVWNSEIYIKSSLVEMLS